MQRSSKPTRCAPDDGASAIARQAARSAFVYFDASRSSPTFMENAGGSQVPRCVADAVRDHLLHDCAQLDAGHEVSVRSTAKVHAAHATMEAFMGAASAGRVALGPSTSQLLASLGECYAQLLGPGDEVVVQESNHESNAGPWVRCAERSGATLRWWRTDVTAAFAAADGGAGGDVRVSFPCASRPASLRALLGPATRLVAVTAVSNLLGAVADVPRIVQMVRELAPRARVVVDGVAFAPHMLVDAAAWGVDWYALSIYKTWGPHAAALYGSSAAFDELAAARGPNHYWISPSDPTYWFELGGISHEACAGVVAISDYLRLLARHDAVGNGAGADGIIVAQDGAPAATNGLDGGSGGGGDKGAPPLLRSEVEAAFRVMCRLEAPLAAPILDFLQAHPRVIVVGPGLVGGGAAEGAGQAAASSESAGAAAGADGADHGWVRRVPTISFVHVTKESRQVAREVQARGYAIRSGHAYAHRLVRALTPAILPHLRREQAEQQQQEQQQQQPAGGPCSAPSSAPKRYDQGWEAGLSAAERAFLEDGVVRVSLLHYNTPEEVDGLLQALGEVL